MDENYIPLFYVNIIRYICPNLADDLAITCQQKEPHNIDGVYNIASHMWEAILVQVFW